MTCISLLLEKWGNSKIYISCNFLVFVIFIFIYKMKSGKSNADKIKKHGYSITIHYSPEDVARMTRQALEKIQALDILELDPDELTALKKYEETHKS